MVHLQSCTESGLLLLTLLRAGMERFLPSASGSSAAGLKPCGEPTCKFKSQLVTSVHQCPCGRSMHGFCGRGIGKEGHGQQRECTDCQKRTAGDKTSFSNTTPIAVQQSYSLGGRGEVDFHYKKKNETFNHLQRCGDHFFGVFVTCEYSCCNGVSFDVGYVSVDPGEGELPSPES